MASLSVSVVEYRDRKNLVLCYRHPESGRLFTRSAGTADKRDAQKAAGAWETEIEHGRWTPETRRRKNARDGGGIGPQMGWGAFRLYFEQNYRGTKRVVRRTTHCNNATALDAFELVCRPSHAADLTTDRLLAFAKGLREPMPNGRVRSDATISRHLRAIKAICRWAHSKGLLAAVPSFDIPTGVNRAKSRPVTEEELERMLDAAAKVVGEKHAASWRVLLRGLWCSGLRLGEALALSWEPSPGGCWVELDGRRSVIMFDGDSQKNGQAKPSPMAPEFVQLLEGMPREGRFVFNPIGKMGGVIRLTGTASKRICDIGEAARVVTSAEKGKFASAHDLRRAFGTRWSKRVRPQQLQALMRHSNISTTMAFYVQHDAEDEAAALWDALPDQQPVQHLSAGQHSQPAFDAPRVGAERV